MKQKRTWLITFTPVALAGSLLLGANLAAQPQSADATSTTATNSPAVAAEADDTNAQTASSSTGGESVKTAAKARGIQREAVVVFGRDVELKAGDSAETVVVIGGSAKIRGHVRDAVVAIGGDVDIEGEVGEAAVAVLGNLRAGQGADIRGDAVAVMGKFTAAAGATVHGDVVAVGGKADVADGATIHGHVQEVEVPALVGLKQWFLQCVLKMRPLAPQVGWVWIVAGIFFVVYLFIALVFPRPVQACVEELTRRPATTFLLGVLTKILVPVVMLILIATGIGMLIVPFLSAALFLGAILGKVALLEWLGMRLGQGFGLEFLRKPLVAFLIGTIILVLLYMVPVLGLLTFGVTSLWGLGTVVAAAFVGMRREMPPKPAAAVPAAPSGPMGPMAMPGTPAFESGFASPIDPSGGGGVATAALPAVAAPAVPEAFAHPRAGFWERMAAAFLDIVLVSVVGGFVGHAPLGFLVALAYFAGMWTWKATTIGGIVLGLKVARADGQPVTFAVAIVRALAAAFAVMVLFLGILWIAWDKEKQGWHDKIAGTVVLKLPRGTPLVCI